MAKPINIGNKSFPTQKAAKEFIHERFKHYGKDHHGMLFVPWTEEGDEQIMLAFISNSNHFHEKYYQLEGTCSIGQERCAGNNWRPAVITSENGKDKVIYFGLKATWEQIICSPEKAKANSWSRVLRSTINPHIKEMKLEWYRAGEVRCSQTNVVLHEWDCHADHAGEYTFSVIVQKFNQYLADNNVPQENFNTKELPWGEKVLADSDATVWIDFHNYLADIRPLLDKENMKKGNRNNG